MRFIIVTLSLAVVSFAVQAFLPWWSLVLVAFIFGIISNLGNMQAFMSGLLGIGLVWLLLAFFIDNTTQSILSEKIAPVLKLSSPAMLLVITFAVGGLTGAFAMLSGASLRRHF